jgi:hypothetical protein
MLHPLKYSPHLTDEDRMRAFLAILVLAIAAASGTATGQTAQTNRTYGNRNIRRSKGSASKARSVGGHTRSESTPASEVRGALVRRAGDQVNVLVSLRPPAQGCQRSSRSKRRGMLGPSPYRKPNQSSGRKWPCVTHSGAKLVRTYSLVSSWWPARTCRQVATGKVPSGSPAAPHGGSISGNGVWTVPLSIPIAVRFRFGSLQTAVL